MKKIQAWWYRPTLPVLEKQRQGNQEFSVIPYKIMSLYPGWATCLKKNNRKVIQIKYAIS